MAPKRLITEGVGEETGNVCVNVTSLNILNMPHILRFFFFSSRCRLFHNAIFSGSCNIHILNTSVLKF
jgi:hypothetical protein